MSLPQMPTTNPFRTLARSRTNTERSRRALASTAGATRNSQVRVAADTAITSATAATASVAALLEATQANADALAALMARIKRGTVTITPTAADTPTSATIVFDAPMPSEPGILLTAQGTTPGTQITGVSYSAVSPDGFTAWVTRTNTTATTLTWFAVAT